MFEPIRNTVGELHDYRDQSKRVNSTMVGVQSIQVKCSKCKEAKSIRGGTYKNIGKTRFFTCKECK